MIELPPLPTPDQIRSYRDDNGTGMMETKRILQREWRLRVLTDLHHAVQDDVVTNRDLIRALIEISLVEMGSIPDALSV